MADAIYIVTVAGGKCVQNMQGTHPYVLDNLPTGQENQKWILEASDDDPNVVAFKSCVDGQYLRNLEPFKNEWANVGVGEKQWWTLSKGKNPGSCLIRSNACTIGNSYLNDFNGEYHDRNRVHMWCMWVSARFEIQLSEKWWLTLWIQEHVQFWLDWYLQPVDSTFNPGGVKGSAQEKALAEKEQQMNEREQQRAKELDEKDALLREREQKLADQEEVLKQKEQQSVKSDQAKPSTGSTNTKPATKSKDAGDARKSDRDLDLIKAQNDRLKLQLKVHELEEQLAEARQPASKKDASIPIKGTTPPAKPKQVNGTKPLREPTAKPVTSANTSKPLSKPSPAKVHSEGTNGAATSAGGPVAFQCGHVVYPPPRKIKRRLIGLMYEGLDKPRTFPARQRAAMAKG